MANILSNPLTTSRQGQRGENNAKPPQAYQIITFWP